jgi:hypothetical protein
LLTIYRKYQVLKSGGRRCSNLQQPTPKATAVPGKQNVIGAKRLGPVEMVAGAGFEPATFRL